MRTLLCLVKGGSQSREVPRSVLGFFVLLVLVPTSCSPSTRTEEHARVVRLLSLMRQRLDVMHDVARWKWNAGQPITDAAREDAFLKRVEDKSGPLGLEPGFARSFFRAQIEAAKLLQEDDVRRWRDEGRGKFADVPDLAGELRPRIDGLGEQILKELCDVYPLLNQGGLTRSTVEGLAAEIVRGDGITPAVRAAAVAPLIGR